MSRMLRTREAAAFLGMSVSALKARVAAGTAPPRHKLGTASNSPVLWDAEELTAWVLSHNAYGRRA